MIRLEALRVRAGDFSLAIDDLSIAPGEYVMVLGPTASGKTVLLETIAGLRRPQAGRVWFGDREVTSEAPEGRGTGLVYQDYALFPHLTVAENISFGLTWRRSQRNQGSRVSELAAMLGIGGLLKRYPEGLSGGERQRVALARALAIEPEVLLLDEPLSALDGPTRTDLQRQLAQIHRDLGATVMHVTHDLDEALALGDRMAVLMDGRLSQVGVPEYVTRHPADTDVARLVGLANVFAVASLTPGGRVSAGGSGDGGVLVRLANGTELLVEESAAPAARPAASLYAAIPAEEIELTPLETASGLTAGASWESGDRAGANVINGVTTSVRVQSVHAVIEVEARSPVSGAAPLTVVVHVLRPEVEKMGIRPGLQVGLRIPVAAVHICRAASRAV